MSERILIGGEPIDVPPEVVTAGRAAVQAWHEAQLAVRGYPVPSSIAAPDPAPPPVASAESTHPEREE